MLAVRGNVDRGLWAGDLPKTRLEEIDGTHVYLLHDLGELDLDPVAAGVQVVIFGHSHQPSVRSDRGVLYVNPGTPVPAAFTIPSPWPACGWGRARRRRRSSTCCASGRKDRRRDDNSEDGLTWQVIWKILEEAESLNSAFPPAILPAPHP